MTGAISKSDRIWEKASLTYIAIQQQDYKICFTKLYMYSCVHSLIIHSGWVASYQ